MPARFPFSSRRIRHALLLSAAAAACAAPLLAVHAEPTPNGLHKVRNIHRLESGEPYALVRADSRMSMTGNNVSSEQLEALKGSVQGEFFWFRKDGKEYIVQDAATLARVRQAWAPMEKTGAEMEKHGQEMGRHGKAMGDYGSEMALAAATLNKAKMEAIGKQMEEAGKPMEAIGKQMEALGERMEAQQKDADKATRGIIDESVASGVARPAPKRS
ncbi:hypothetical protein [Massilia suwonensis]|uniref:DUF2884 family protein n=1 Tax=Massilia suwonensis TaxID=648895 RepID=A0ABW0MM11_9BURK